MRVIAIDGPAGSGKSTVAKALAVRLNLDYLDTGAMYRAVAFAAIQEKIEPNDIKKITEVAESLELELTEESCVVNGVDATKEIRGPEVTSLVSQIATMSEVRIEMVKRQRAWAESRDGGVMEGRDIGSVVFPDAMLKIYLTASEEVRAERRAAEVKEEDIATVAADIERRDTVDTQRSTSPLIEAEDAIVVDTSEMTIEQAVEYVIGLMP